MLTEGLKEQELRDLVHNEIHIDEFQAKMGDDSDIIVSSFKVRYQAPAQDFERFLEKGYDFILDAETSEAEFASGWYLVFMEMERNSSFSKNLITVLTDLKNVTNTKKWKFRYGPSRKRNTPEWPVSTRNLDQMIPLSPKKYRELVDTDKETEALDAMLMAAKVHIKKDIRLTEETEKLRLQAGLPVNGFEKAKTRSRRG